MLGPESVVTAFVVGGRTPAERISWVPWGEEVDAAASAASAAPWPGTVPGPSPARVFDPPLAAALLDGDGEAVTVNGRGEASASPALLQCADLANGGGPVVASAGPWPHDVRWWEHRTRRRRALWQVVVAGEADTRVACLVSVSRGRAEVEAVYD
jgi:protein ImuB